jgi:hypothetical protein
MAEIKEQNQYKPADAVTDTWANLLLRRVSWTGVRAGARCRLTRPRSGIGQCGNEASSRARRESDPRKARGTPRSIYLRRAPILMFTQILILILMRGNAQLLAHYLRLL